MRLALAGIMFFATGLYAQPSAASPITPGTPYVPMTGEERWKLYLHDNFEDPTAYFRALGAGAGQQIANAPPEWHQGAKAYFKRSGSSFGQFLADDSVRTVLAAAAGLDTRYHLCGCEGAKARVLYAIKWTFITRNHEGKVRFDWARFSGDYAGAFIANAWYPDRYGVKDALRSGHQQAAFEIGGNILREFTPEIKRLFHRK